MAKVDKNEYNPLISVIMSTKDTNVEYLKYSVESILNQTNSDIEFIIVIDGGNDYQLLKEFDDKRIKYIKHNNSIGLTKSLNQAIGICKGKYIARMDSDDYSFPYRFEMQVKYMEKNKNIDIVSTYYDTFGVENRHVTEVFCKPEYVKAKLFFTNVICHPSVMMRKSFIDKYRVLYDESYTYSQDYELWTRCSKFGKLAILNKKCVKYRVHKKQISTEKIGLQNEFCFKVLQRNLSELGLPNSDIAFLEILRGSKSISSKKELRFFIKKVIRQNKIYKIYNNKAIKCILYTYYNISCLKNRKLFIPNYQFVLYGFKKIASKACTIFR